MTIPDKGSHPPFWQRSLGSILSELRTDGAGLDAAEAERRFEAHGPNVLHPPRKRALALEFLSRFGNPLIILLVAAAAISGVTGDKASLVIIEVVIVLSVTLDFVQEYRAGRAAERLKQSVALRATAIRGGRLVEVSTDRIVPGDVVQLEAGELVPADGRVLEARDLFVNEALLTGEPYAAEKRAGELSEPTGEMAAASNAVFMGTSVIGGMARVIICSTGSSTALGRIGDSLIVKPPATAFETGTRLFGLLILRIAILMVLFVVLVNGLFHRPWLQSFLFAVALAVGLTPEMLPMIVSVTLSRGALRLARERMIVKRLAAVSDLGSMDVLCTDKTGTLTEARIRLQKHVDPLGRDSARVLELAYLNSSFQTGIKNPLDEAILRERNVALRSWRKIDEVPFDFERRRVSVLADDGHERLLVVKGAFEDVLRHSIRYEANGPGALLPLDAAAQRKLNQRFESLSREGYRVLGIAWKATGRDRSHVVVDDETELAFAGFAAFEDPPKLSAAEAVRSLEASGVAVRIVTGDNELVTQHVCAELGLAVHGVLTGREIEVMDEAALAARAETVNLFCRVTPTQKSRVIRALRSRRHVVGYLGDGINDAPSIHSADVGLSLDTAVDVAKEAADLILLGKDLGVIHRGVLEGRRTFGNVIKYLMMGTSSNFGSMFSMAGGTLILPFLPLLPVQILVNNLLYDISEIPIPTDNVDQEFIEKPRGWNLATLRNFMLVIGPVSSIFDFLTFWVMLEVFSAGEALFHTGWFMESIATQVLVIFVIRTRGNPLHSRPSLALTVTSLAAVAVGMALPYTPLGARLGFVPLPAVFFLILGAIVLVYLVMVQGVKDWFYRHLASEWA